MTAITFHDQSDDMGDTLVVSDRGGTEPMLLFRARRKESVGGTTVVLNYAQVFKLRDKLNRFLAEKLGHGAPLWTEDE